MKKFLKYNILIAIAFFVLVIFLILNSKLTFGFGLGDLFFLFLHLGWLFILITVFSIMVKRKLAVNRLFSLLISFILLLSIFLSIKAFTVDRGSEYPWNGRIFMMSKTEWIRLEEDKYKNRMDNLDKIIHNSPTDFKSITAKGLLLNDKEKWDLSIIEFKKALQINPNYFEALFGLGVSYCGIRDYADAIREFERAKLIDSTRENVSNRIRNLKSYYKIK